MHGVSWRLSGCRWEEKSEYLSLWIALRYTPIAIVVSLGETKVSKKAICWSDSS